VVRCTSDLHLRCIERFVPGRRKKANDLVAHAVQRSNERKMNMLILIIILVLVLGSGGGYYGHSRWGYGGGAGIGLGTILLILLVAYMLGIFH
jgi:hypothetical protein